jgi:organic hydroperoxide reductase OsmC/OhrA
MTQGKEHTYQIEVNWTGNHGEGTSSYRAYSRAHEIVAAGKPILPGSSDPAFRGEASRYNPEELLVASLSGCHMLWYLHLCADAGIVVTDYVDQARGTMVETRDGAGAFAEVVLRPVVTVRSAAEAERASALHEQAHERCFIARSVNFPVRCEPRVEIAASVSA